MKFIEFILILLSGAASGFMVYKYLLKKWSRQLNNTIDDLNENKSVANSGGKVKDQLPPELSSIVNKIEIIIQQKQKLTAEPEQISEPKDDFRKYQKTIDNLYIVNELGQKVTSSLNLQQTFQHLYTTINSMMDAALLELNVVDETSGIRKSFTNFSAKDSDKSDFTNHMADWCFKNRREVFLSDAENDFGRYVFQPLVLPDGRVVKSIIIFPVTNRNVVTGTLSVISFQKNSFSEYHQEIIRLLLGFISVAIENAIRHEELNVTKIRAEQSEKFKEQFLANMSHEIRTPINAITGMSRLLLEKQPRNDQLRFLDSIRNASDSLLVIINDILDLSKIEAGKIELERIDFSLSDLVKNVKEIMQFKAEEKGLVFNNSIDSTIPPVVIGDPTRLTQILINLVGNAVKFTSKGSVQINLSLNGSNEKITSLNGEEGQEVNVKFEVVDTGIGMTKDQQSKLFQDYAQASPETARKYGGTGLGLSISRQLVQLQGGIIKVDSEEGRGSCFSFNISFPISKNKSISVKEKNISKEMLNDLKGIKVLLADDNEYNRIVVMESLFLKIEGCMIDAAYDGNLAIEMVKKNDYDLILMDLVMPNLDGLEATKIIRNLPPPKNEIPIIALTASVVKSEIDKCYAAGMNGFIPKPFKAFELFGTIYKSIHNQKEVVFEDVVVNKNSSKPKGVYVDLNYLNDFTEGDEFRFKKYIDLFLTKTPVNLNIIKSAFETEDFEKLQIIAHSMKPQLEAVGLFQGKELAEKIEKLCRLKTNLNQLPELIKELEEICDKAINELKDLIKLI